MHKQNTTKVLQLRKTYFTTEAQQILITRNKMSRIIALCTAVCWKRLILSRNQEIVYRFKCGMVFEQDTDFFTITMFCFYLLTKHSWSILFYLIILFLRKAHLREKLHTLCSVWGIQTMERKIVFSLCHVGHIYFNVLQFVKVEV